MAEEKSYLLDNEELEFFKLVLSTYVEDSDGDAGERVDALWRKIKDVESSPKMFRAHFQTRDFEFEGYGTTNDEAVDACYEGWVRHCYGYRPGVQLDVSLVSKEDISVYEVKATVPYRDHEEIEPAPAGKELVVVEVQKLGEAPEFQILAMEEGFSERRKIEDFWCECEEETESEFHDDEFDSETGERVSKHHWTCRSCGKVKQIG